MKKNIIILNYTVKIKTNNEETTHNTSTNNFLIDKYETNVEYEVKVRASKDGCLGDWSEIIKLKLLMTLKIIKIFFYHLIYLS